jgi:coenzyme F420-reducing hydrogenase gamma subunit
MGILDPADGVLDDVRIVYWPMVLDAELPDEYDIAVVEGAVTSEEHEELLRTVRSTARSVIALGACALTSGVVGLGPQAAGGQHERPRAVTDVIDVDYHVHGCPVTVRSFVQTLHRAIEGTAEEPPARSMCAE